jgi:serine/threonine protein kinase
MGEVYRARDTRLERDVAVKVLPERVAKDPDALARFEREARTVAGSKDPNVRGVRDPEAPNGWRIDLDPFPGWKDVPT